MFTKFPYENLLLWHEKSGRHDLPWRRGLSDRDEKARGYRVWLSEILLQQTQAPRVAPFFERMVERFPTVESLAEADFETFFPYYDGLGYYSRARNLLAAAKKVTADFGGVFPKSTEALRTLPGVGPYTAEAVRAFAYEIPTLPFDTNLEKIFSRYYFGSRFRKLSAEEKSEITAAFLKSGFDARTVSWALMDFANVVSVNSVAKVEWSGYPLPGCRFHETRGALEDRPKKRPERFPMKDSVLVAILADHSGKELFSSWRGYVPDSKGLAPNKVEVAAAPSNPARTSGRRNYAPFLVPPTEGDPREAIKRHFLEMGLSVSVRPPYSKGFLDGAPLAFFRCRVQTGTPQSPTFPESAFGDWWESESEGKEKDFSKLP